MPEIEKKSVDTEKKEIHIFYILDTSGSMKGLSIGQINYAMPELKSALKEIARKNRDTQIKIGILSFNSICEWVTENGLVELESFEWENLSEGELSNIGAALTELNNKISSEDFTGTITDNYSPFFVFMTDGLATDDYSKPLSEIKQKKWFDNGTKIGFEIGDDVEIDQNMIAEIIGSKENIIKSKDLDKFAHLIKKGITSNNENQ